MNIYNYHLRLHIYSVIVVLFIFTLVTSIFFYIHTFVKKNEKKKEVLFIESAIASLDLEKDTFTSIMLFHPKSYNLGSGTFYMTVEKATSVNYVEFRVVDANGEILSNTVRATSFFQTPLHFTVKDDNIDIRLQYKASKNWDGDTQNAPSLIRLELEY